MSEMGENWQRKIRVVYIGKGHDFLSVKSNVQEMLIYFSLGCVLSSSSLDFQQIYSQSLFDSPAFLRLFSQQERFRATTQLTPPFSSKWCLSLRVLLWFSSGACFFHFFSISELFLNFEFCGIIDLYVQDLICFDKWSSFKCTLKSRYRTSPLLQKVHLYPLAVNSLPQRIKYYPNALFFSSEFRIGEITRYMLFHVFPLFNIFTFVYIVI